MSNVVAFQSLHPSTNPSATRHIKPSAPIAFDRMELGDILRVYGQRVARGEWRDYAIDMMRDRAVFSIFRRTSEMPLFRIVKDPRLAKKQGVYFILNPSGQIIKRGHSLKQLLKHFDRQYEILD